MTLDITINQHKWNKKKKNSKSAEKIKMGSTVKDSCKSDHRVHICRPYLERRQSSHHCWKQCRSCCWTWTRTQRRSEEWRSTQAGYCISLTELSRTNNHISSEMTEATYKKVEVANQHRLWWRCRRRRSFATAQFPAAPLTPQAAKVPTEGGADHNCCVWMWKKAQ